jgi:hypothetical protein
MKNSSLPKSIKLLFSIAFIIALNLQLCSQTINWTNQIQQVGQRYYNRIWADYVSSDKWNNCYSVYKVLENGRLRIVTKKIADVSGSWVRTYYPPDTSLDCQPSAIQTDGFGETYVLCSTGNQTTNSVGLVLKYNINGDLLWTYNIDSTGANVGPIAMKKDNSGNIVIICQLTVRIFPNDYSSYHTIKLSSSGSLIWKRSYRDEFYNAYPSDLWVDNNNDIFVTGSKKASGTSPFYQLTLKYSSGGAFLWGTTHSFNTEYFTYILQMQRITGDNTGSFYVTGTYWLNNEPRLRVNKYSSSGALLWSYVHSSYSVGSSITRDKYGNILVGGLIKSNIGTGNDMAAFKLNSTNGGLLVANFYEGQNTDYDYASDIKTDTSGNIFLFGYDGYTQMMKLIKVNNFLKVKWQVSITQVYRPYNISNNKDGSIFVTADKDSLAYRFNVISRITDLGAYAKITNLSGGENGSPFRFSLGQNYPNPFNPATNFEFQIAGRGQVNLTVYDVLGRAVETLVNSELEPGAYKVSWDASAQSSGIYFYTLKAKDFTDTKRMMLIK